MYVVVCLSECRAPTAQLTSLFVIMCIGITSFAIVGMELFGSMSTPEVALVGGNSTTIAVVPRQNFGTMYNSLLALFRAVSVGLPFPLFFDMLSAPNGAAAPFSLSPFGIGIRRACDMTALKCLYLRRWVLI